MSDELALARAALDCLINEEDPRGIAPAAELARSCRKALSLLPPTPVTTSNTETLVMEFDGASRGNPGPSGVGFVLSDAKGEVILEEGAPIAPTTNNQAEYRALLLGLTRAIALGTRKLSIRSDSELLVKQLKGIYRIKNPQLADLAQQARQLLAKLDSHSIAHISRNLNQRADRLAKNASHQKYHQ